MEFSVVVPTYKRTEKLRKCLEALVNQNTGPTRHPEDPEHSGDEGSLSLSEISHLREILRSAQNDKISYEIIVVEDSDEEGSRAIQLVEEFKERVPQSRGVKGLTPRRCEPQDTSGSKGELVDIIYLSQPHKGPAAARNKGIKKARGKFIAFTDDDCVVPSDWLMKLKKGFERYGRNRHPEERSDEGSPHDRKGVLRSAQNDVGRVVGVGGYMEAPGEILKKNVFAQYESYMTRKVYGAGNKKIVGGFEVPTGGTNNIAYRRDILEEVGGFDETFPVAAGEDADLKKRICDKGYKIAYLPLKVEHHHSFFTSPFPKNLFKFCAQSWRRGIGSAYFHRKHGGGLGRGRLVLNLLLLPFRFVKELIFGGELHWKVICVKYIAVGFDSLAQIFH